jgi:hypothetical protein
VTVLSLPAVVSLCLTHTGSAPRAATATAIAWAESGLDSTARCYNQRDAKGRVVCGPPGPQVLSTDRGLFQFNDKAHPEVSTAKADDPAAATAAAFHTSAGFVDWHQWSSHTLLPGGSAAGTKRGQQVAQIYKIALATAFDQQQAANNKGPSPLTAATAAVGGAMVGAGGAVVSGVSGVAHGAMSLTEFLSNISDPKVWSRVLEVVLGAGAIVLGAFLLDRSLVSQALGTAVTSTLGGAASKVGASAVARGSFRLS